MECLDGVTLTPNSQKGTKPIQPLKEQDGRGVGVVTDQIDGDFWLGVRWEKTEKQNSYRYNYPKSKNGTQRLFDIHVIARSGEMPEYALGSGGTAGAGAAAAAAGRAGARAGTGAAATGGAGVAATSAGDSGSSVTTKSWPGPKLETTELPPPEVERMKALRRLVSEGSVRHLVCNVTKLCTVDVASAPATAGGFVAGDPLNMQMLDPSVAGTYMTLRQPVRGAQVRQLSLSLYICFFLSTYLSIILAWPPSLRPSVPPSPPPSLPPSLSPSLPPFLPNLLPAYLPLITTNRRHVTSTSSFPWALPSGHSTSSRRQSTETLRRAASASGRSPGRTVPTVARRWARQGPAPAFGCPQGC